MISLYFSFSGLDSQGMYRPLSWGVVLLCTCMACIQTLVFLCQFELRANVLSVQGLRPTIPKHTNPKLVELLEKCWKQDPAERPDFSEILQILRYIAKEVDYQILPSVVSYSL